LKSFRESHEWIIHLKIRDLEVRCDDACNPDYWGGRGLKDCGPRLAHTKVRDPI
jgi:hypothetical protein